MENKLILVKHDMFKEETIKIFNPEILELIRHIGDELPQYDGSKYTFRTSFTKEGCMDSYVADFDLFTQSNPSGDHIFLKLEYHSVDCFSIHMNKLRSSNDNVVIFRINNSNTTIKPYNIGEQLNYNGGVNVTILYDISRVLLKEIADAKSFEIKIPLMKTIYETLEKYQQDDELSKEIRQLTQEIYAEERRGFQLMCRLFYAAAIDEKAYPGLVEKEIEIIAKTKKSKDQAFAEFEVEYKKEKRKEKIGEIMSIVAAICYPIALIVGVIWGLIISSWTPIIALLIIVSVILVIMAIARNI